VNIRYVPVLKGRPAELAALGQVATDVTVPGTVPLIEFVPPATDEPEAIRRSIDWIVRRLDMFWPHRPILVDPSYLSPIDLGLGQGPLSVAASDLETRGIPVTPVSRLNDATQNFDDVRSLDKRYGRGVCLRLAGEDLDQDPADVTDQVRRVLHHIGIGTEHLDLILDLGTVDQASIRGSARLARLLLASLSDVEKWRSLTLTSGAFPLDLSELPPWTLGERRRADTDVWVEVIRGRVPRRPDFGDYAVAYPRMVTGTAYSPPPELRYATAENWLVLKGSRRDLRGAEQFYDICDNIAAHPNFAGRELGRADARIADPRQEAPGDAITWQQLATTHHLDFVTRRIADLGEP
jgi:Beta protein